MEKTKKMAIDVNLCQKNTARMGILLTISNLWLKEKELQSFGKIFLLDYSSSFLVTRLGLEPKTPTLKV